MPAPSDDATLVDDFEWPPKADDVSIHEIAAEPWPTAGPAATGAEPIAVTVTVSVDHVQDPAADQPEHAPQPAHPDDAASPADPATARPSTWRRNR